MFVSGKSRTIFSPSNTLIYGISHDGSNNFNVRTCEHMILGQLTIGGRQAKNAPLSVQKSFAQFTPGVKGGGLHSYRVPVVEGGVIGCSTRLNLNFTTQLTNKYCEAMCYIEGGYKVQQGPFGSCNVFCERFW